MVIYFFDPRTRKIDFDKDMTHTTIEMFDALHEAVDRARPGTLEVKADRCAIDALIKDHNELRDECGRDTKTKFYHNNKATSDIYESGRKNSKTVMVDKKILLSILMDHSKMCAILGRT